MIFTATSASTTIDFINLTAQGDNETGLDNVSLDVTATGAPEPATWGLMGLAMAGLAVRRARRS